MADHQFFVKGRNKGNERKVLIASATVLVGKAPAKNKRIKLKVRMNLNDKKIVGTPEWVTNAMTYVAQNHDVVSPIVEFKGFDIDYSSDNLFGEQSVKAPKSDLRGFVVQEAGDSENPIIVLEFTVYCQFSTDLWNWIGQLVGEDVWAKFDQGLIEQDSEEGLKLVSNDDEGEEGESDNE